MSTDDKLNTETPLYEDIAIGGSVEDYMGALRRVLGERDAANARIAALEADNARPREEANQAKHVSEELFSAVAAERDALRSRLDAAERERDEQLDLADTLRYMLDNPAEAVKQIDAIDAVHRERDAALAEVTRLKADLAGLQRVEYNTRQTAEHVAAENARLRGELAAALLVTQSIADDAHVAWRRAVADGAPETTVEYRSGAHVAAGQCVAAIRALAAKGGAT